MNKLWKMTLAAALLAVPGLHSPNARNLPARPVAPPAFDGTLSVLTYNVEGLPWPVARHRPEALASIGERLRTLHEQHRAPTVVVLQEAFIPEAQAIGTAGGYRYIATGAGPDKAASDPNKAFAAAGHWWLGETEGKYLGSGLQVLSDYPIVAVHRVSFPTCAGFDCLANKGALLVTLAIPGAPTPIEIVTTHLNSRQASHTADSRSNEAYRGQVEALTAFVRKTHDPRFPLIVAGDFNVGWAAVRRTMLLGEAYGEWAGGYPVRDALNVYRDRGGVLNADGALSLWRARDWQFFADGSNGTLALTGIDVPFGRERDGEMLSDHVGYVARFRLGPPPRRGAVATAATSSGRSIT